MPMTFFRFFRCQKARLLFNDFVREAVVIASLRKVSRGMIFCSLFCADPGTVIGNLYFNRAAVVVAWLRKDSQQSPGSEFTKVFPPICQWISFVFFFAFKRRGYCSKRFCSRGRSNSVIEESVARHDILLAFCADPGRLIGNWYFNRTAIIVTWLRKTSQQLPGHESTKVSFRSICQWLSFVFFGAKKHGYCSTILFERQ